MHSQGTRESLDFFWRSLEAPRYQVNANRSVFYLIFEMTIEERDVSKMSENMKATIWAATHCLGQMRFLLMHEKHKVWKREFGYDVLKRLPRWMKNALAPAPAQFQTFSSIETWLFLNTLIRRKNSISKESRRRRLADENHSLATPVVRV